MRDSLPRSAAPNESLIDFLVNDLDLALTFTQLAETSSSVETRERNYGNARKAYDDVLRYRHNLRADVEQQATIDLKLAMLRERLIAAGHEV